MIQPIAITLKSEGRDDYVSRQWAVIVGDIAVHRWIYDPDWWQMTHVPTQRLVMVFSSTVNHSDMLKVAQRINAITRSCPMIESDQSWETDEFKAWYEIHKPELISLRDEYGL